MRASVLRPEDEGRHLPGTEPVWGESWYHDFAASDGSLGGWLRLGLYPNLGVAWYWLAIVRLGEPLVLISDAKAPCPSRDAPLDLQTARYCASWRCTDPLRAWRITTGRITTEGTAVAFANPADVFARARGRDVDVRLDLVWKGAIPAFPYRATTRYEQAAWVEGEVVVDGVRLPVISPGQRDHSWGNRVWSIPWLWCSGRLEDGTWFHMARTLVSAGSNFQTGFVADAETGLRAVDTVEVRHRLDPDGLPVEAMLSLGGLTLAATPELHAPVLIPSPDDVESRLARALCRFEASEGRTGRGWIEFNVPAS